MKLNKITLLFFIIYELGLGLILFIFKDWKGILLAGFIWLIVVVGIDVWLKKRRD